MAGASYGFLDHFGAIVGMAVDKIFNSAAKNDDNWEWELLVRTHTVKDMLGWQSKAGITYH